MTKKTVFRHLTKSLRAGLLCASIFTHDAVGIMVHKNNLDRQIQDSAQQYLISQGLDSQRIPESLRSEYQQKLSDIKQQVLHQLKLQGTNYADTSDVEQIVRENIYWLTTNMQNVVNNYQLESAVTTALNTYLVAKGLSPNTLPAQSIEEYINRSASIMNALQTLMRNEGRTYVHVSEIEKTIKEWMDVFAARMRASYAPVNNHTFVPPITYNPPVHTEPTNTNKIMRHQLEQKTLEIVYAILRTYNIDPSNIPARVVSDYSEKIQVIMRRMKDSMSRSYQDYVWKDVLEQTALQEMQPVIDKIFYKGELCVICQENYSSGQRVGILSCNHVYHKECIYSWLETSKNCPLCRQANVIVAKQEIVK